MNIYWSCAPLIFWTSVSTVGLSERGLNLGYLTCSLMAMCYVLCRELVIGVWGLEPETNLKWMNIYWSYAPPILDVRPDRRSVWEVSELTCFICNGNMLFSVEFFFKVSRFGVTQFTQYIQFNRFTQSTQFTQFTHSTQFMFYFLSLVM